MISPSYGRRFGALLADWILCLLVSGLFARPMVDGWAPVLVLIVEYAFFVGLFGQTPGMRMAGLTCMDHETDRPVGFYRGLLRGVLLALVVPALLNDSQRRGLHDRLAGTLMRMHPDRVLQASEPVAGKQL